MSSWIEHANSSRARDPPARRAVGLLVLAVDPDARAVVLDHGVDRRRIVDRAQPVRMVLRAHRARGRRGTTRRDRARSTPRRASRSGRRTTSATSSAAKRASQRSSASTNGMPSRIATRVIASGASTASRWATPLPRSCPATAKRSWPSAAITRHDVARHRALGVRLVVGRGRRPTWSRTRAGRGTPRCDARRAAARRRATSCACADGRAAARTGGPSPPWRTRIVASPVSMRSSANPSKKVMPATCTFQRVVKRRRRKARVRRRCSARPSPAPAGPRC